MIRDEMFNTGIELFYIMIYYRKCFMIHFKLTWIHIFFTTYLNIQINLMKKFIYFYIKFFQILRNEHCIIVFLVVVFFYYFILHLNVWYWKQRLQTECSFYIMMIRKFCSKWENQVFVVLYLDTQKELFECRMFSFCIHILFVQRDICLYLYCISSQMFAYLPSRT